MKLKNVKIGYQILLGIVIILGLFFAIGLTSFNQTKRIHDQTYKLYNHPFQVRKAIGDLNTNIQKMRVSLRDLMLAQNYQEKEKAVMEIEHANSNVEEMFEKIKVHYLGPKSDVNEAYLAYTLWKTERGKSIDMAFSGDIQMIKDRSKESGDVGILREKMLKKIMVMDYFAFKKGDEIFNESEMLLEKLNNQLLIIIFLAFLITVVIYFIFIFYIKSPIQKLILTTIAYSKGDHSARVNYESENEVGRLAKAFNVLAENVMNNENLNEKINQFSNEMVIHDDAKDFFKITLQNLLQNTGSQMGSVYLINKQKDGFQHYFSIGIDDSMPPFFSYKEFEGAFGEPSLSLKMKYLKNLATKSKIKFSTPFDDYMVNEMIIIPIVNFNEVVAFISLATIYEYNEMAIKFVEKINKIYSARIEGVVAYRKNLKFSEELKLEKDNLKNLNEVLESQKIELNQTSIELAEQNRELEVQKEQLNEVNKLKTSFLSNMSHELRTPLNSVIALSGVLSRKLKEQISEEEYSYLDVIQRNGKHLLSLINDILDISRIESGREEFDISQFTLCSCINEVIEMVKPQIMEKNLELELAQGDCHVEMKSDFKKISHIVQNIISNAVKFTEKGNISISVVEKKEMVVIHVHDTGIGIAKENLEHIFDEFRQADSGTSRKYGGTGLGLSIAKKYAELLGGSISVESEVGLGSHFMISLPIELNPNSSSEIQYQYENSFKSHFVDSKTMINHNITILLVDDSDPAIIQMKDFLEESGFNVKIAHNGHEALQQIQNEIPDGIILDLMMPGMDGFSLLKLIRDNEITTNIPVLIVTAKHITKDEMTFLKKNNIFQFIQKGDVNHEEFIQAVSGMVSIQKNIIKEKVNPRDVKKTHLSDKRCKILIVEDNPDNMLTVKVLLQENYDLIEAYDGKEGVELALLHIPDLILMDISLPVLDGIEAFKQIRKHPSLEHIPVIALTASALTEDREKILAEGFDHFLAKPIDEQTFFITIKELLYGI